jgi:hypothetical protein
MKGIVNVLELLLAGIILILAFLHFFPQYSVRTNWSSVILELMVRDTLTIIERTNKIYEFTTQDSNFENFMSNLYSLDSTGQSLIWWKEIDVSSPALPGASSTNRPYFTEAKEETIVDVVEISDEFYIYSFTLGMGYPY